MLLCKGSTIKMTWKEQEEVCTGASILMIIVHTKMQFPFRNIIGGGGGGTKDTVINQP